MESDLDDCRTGLSAGGKRLNNLHFSDDTTLLASG